MNKQQSPKFETNPFLIGINGISRVFKVNTNSALFIIVISIAFSVLSQIIAAVFSDQSTANALLLNIGISGISALISLIAITIVLSTQHNKEMSISEAFSTSLERFLPYLGYSIVYSLLVVFGFILLIVPGILATIWFSLVIYVKFDEGGKLQDVFKRSRELVRGRAMEYFGVAIVGFIFSVFGLIGPIMIAAVTGEWYQQLKIARDGHHELPPVSKINHLLFFGLIALMILFIGLITLLIYAATHVS